MKLLSFILVFVCLNGFAQLSNEKYLIEYKKGVQYFANAQYDEAVMTFTPLTARNYTNNVSPYVFFYHGLSSKMLNQPYQTRVVLRQLIERFPDWNKIDEVFLIYAEANFIERYFDEGFNSLERIQDPSYKSISNEMIAKFLLEINNVELLKDLYQKHPTQSLLAEKLVASIQSKKYPSKEDLKLSDELTNRFSLKPKKDIKKPVSVRKTIANSEGQSIDIALLLPFNLAKSANINSLFSVKYIYEMYFGMQMAVEKLATEQVYVNLLCYDVEKSEAAYKKIEDSQDFKNVDLIIGPLYPNINKLASKYVSDNNLVQMHPISNNNNLTNSSPFVFLGQSSHLGQAQKALDFAKEQNFNNSISIYFGKSLKDSLFAINVKDEAIKRGLKVLDFTSFKGVNSIKNTSPGFIFVACESSLTNKILTGLNQKNVTAPIISSVSSFDLNLVSFQNLKNELFLLNPEFIDKEKENVKKFNSDFKQKMNSLPSYYAYYGYDLVLYYARMLKDGKSIFRLNLDTKDYSNDYLGVGFDYSQNKNENQLVPVVKYADGQFIEVFR